MSDNLNYIDIYKDLLLARRFEEKCAQAYGMGLINGFCHLYIGQEAISVGIKYAKSNIDQVITSYRCHAEAILLGESTKAVMAELFGKETGSSKGKGGSMHIFSPENNFWGGHGIVGAPAAIGTGIAFANKYKNTNAISITMYGDGAANQGQVFESFNMASLWNLPVLYIVENNGYSMGTSCIRHASCKGKFYKRGESMNISGDIHNGMDFFEVYNAVKNALELIRKTSRPYILQFDCYRYKGHSMSDAAKYRTKDEVESYKEQDPIKKFSNFLLQNNINSDLLEKIDETISFEIEEAFEFAKSSNYPNNEELDKDI